MSKIEFLNDMIQIDASIVAKAFQISPDDLKLGMRSGAITSQSEHGEGDDAGKVRLTFFSANRRVRVTADDQGKVLTCSSADYTKHSARTGDAK